MCPRCLGGVWPGSRPARAPSGDRGGRARRPSHCLSGMATTRRIAQRIWYDDSPPGTDRGPRHRRAPRHRRVPPGAWIMLERSGGQLARSVLRGLGEREPPWLPGDAEEASKSVMSRDSQGITKQESQASNSGCKEKHVGLFVPVARYRRPLVADLQRYGAGDGLSQANPEYGAGVESTDLTVVPMGCSVPIVYGHEPAVGVLRKTKHIFPARHL
jgi:hypothetical protein